MLNNFRKRLVATTLLSAAMALGCDDRPPTAPTLVLPAITDANASADCDASQGYGRHAGQGGNHGSD